MRAERHKVYGSRAWSELRRAVLMRSPLCAVCELMGRTALAEDVHHIVPLSEAPARALDPSNLMPLCKRCHRDIHHGLLAGCRSLEEAARRLGRHI